MNPFALLCRVKWHSSIRKITNSCGTATSTAEQSLQNWIWREALCVSWCRQEWNLWQQRLVAPGWHLFPAAPTTTPKVLLRAVTDKCSAKHSFSFLIIIINTPRRSRDVDFQAPLHCGGHPKVHTRCRTKGHSIPRGAVFPKYHTIPSDKVGHSYVNTAVKKEVL